MCHFKQGLNVPTLGFMLLIKVLRISGHWSTDRSWLHFEPPQPHCVRPRPSMAPLKAYKSSLHFDFHAESNLSFHSNADPDFASR